MPRSITDFLNQVKLCIVTEMQDLLLGLINFILNFSHDYLIIYDCYLNRSDS